MENNESYFDGTVLGNWVNALLYVLIVVFTLGIALPWAMTMRQNFIVSHTVIEGNRLRFDGNGLQLFGNYIKWWIFSILTLGIYGWFVLPVRLHQWITKHTVYA